MLLRHTFICAIMIHTNCNCRWLVGICFTCTEGRLGVENSIAANSDGFIHLTGFTFLTLPIGPRRLQNLCDKKYNKN